MTSKHLIEHIFIQSKCYKVQLAVPRISPDSNNVPKKGKTPGVFNALSLCPSPPKTHPYKCMGTFKKSMCYTRILAQNILSLTTQYVSLSI